MTTPRLGEAPAPGATGQSSTEVRRGRRRRQSATPALELIEGQRAQVIGQPAVTQYQPPRPREKAVARTILLDRLLTTACHVLVVAAPVGYGKSTLLAQWAAQDGRPFVWLELTPSDNDARALTQRITAAVATLRFTGADVPPLSRVGEDGRRARIELADLLDQVSTPCVVVLDDVHHVRAPASLAVIDTLLQHLPPGSQLAVAGRHAAPLGIRKWRAGYEVLEISAPELAFTAPETSKSLPANSIAAAATHGWSEGWPAAVSIAAAVARSDSSHRFDLHGRLPDMLGQYIESEVLDGLDKADLTFLTRTSILDELTPGACAAVAGEAAAGRNLAALCGATLITAVAPGGARYRCHPLLRQTLLARLELQDAGLIPQLHERAARWFAGIGDLDAAIEHALLADDIDHVGRLIWPLVRPTLSDTELDHLRNLLGKVSPAQCARSPQLVVASAWAAFLSGQLPEMHRWLSLTDVDAHRSWLSDVSAADHCGALALLRAWGCRGGLSEALELSSAAFDGLPSDSPWRPAAGALSGVGLGLSGQTEAARERLHFSAALADAHDDQLTRTDCVAALRALEGGHLSPMLTEGRLWTSAELLAVDGSVRLTNLYTTSVLAEHLARTGGPREATRMLSRARETTDAAAGIAPWLRIHAMVRQSNACLMLGDATSARQLVRAARQLTSEDPAESSLLGVVARAESTLEALPADPAFGLPPFTAAERRILRLLPTHLSYVEMGLLLSVSRHTVKTQALAVYRKLGAVSRHEAVQRASAVGFFDPITVPEWVTA